MAFTRAERRRARLRLGVVGPAGSGKTMSALLIAKGLGGRIAVVDTEQRSAELYADVCEYDVQPLTAPYDPKKYIAAIHEAEAAGYATVILDSLSHAWAGEGGLLDTHGKLADRGTNSFAAWRTVTPQHNALIEAMLQSSCHIIATMRSKTEYVIEQDDKGRSAPRKVGMAPVQREGMDYEFTVVLELDQKHVAQSSKDRTRLFDGRLFTPTQQTGSELLTWLENGAPQAAQVAPPPTAPADPEPPASSAALKRDVWDGLVAVLGSKEAATQLLREETGKDKGYTAQDWMRMASVLAKLKDR